MNARYVECCIGNLLEGDRGTPSNELDKQVRTVFSNKTLGCLEECGYGCGPLDAGDGFVKFCTK